MVEKRPLIYSFVPGLPRSRIDSRLVIAGDRLLTVDDVTEATEALTNSKQRDDFNNNLDIDFTIYIKNLILVLELVYSYRELALLGYKKGKQGSQSFKDLNLPSKY